jgi:hypothetical protein
MRRFNLLVISVLLPDVAAHEHDADSDHIVMLVGGIDLSQCLAAATQPEQPAPAVVSFRRHGPPAGDHQRAALPAEL